MKKWTSLLTACLVTLGITGCTHNTPIPPSNPLIGKWLHKDTGTYSYSLVHISIDTVDPSQLKMDIYLPKKMISEDPSPSYAYYAKPQKDSEHSYDTAPFPQKEWKGVKRPIPEHQLEYDPTDKQFIWIGRTYHIYSPTDDRDFIESAHDKARRSVNSPFNRFMRGLHEIFNE